MRNFAPVCFGLRRQPVDRELSQSSSTMLQSSLQLRSSGNFYEIKYCCSAENGLSMRALLYSVTYMYDKEMLQTINSPLLPNLHLLSRISCRHFLHMLCEQGSSSGSAYSSKQTGHVNSSSILICRNHFSHL